MTDLPQPPPIPPGWRDWGPLEQRAHDLEMRYWEYRRACAMVGDEPIGREEYLAHIEAEDELEAAKEQRWPRLKAGDEFLFGGEPTTEPLWGKGDQVLWAPGEPLMICGPTGVGKTTLANQLLYARFGLATEVLGLPVLADDRPVLILAMDRPKQARKAMLRLFNEPEHGEMLAKRLVVHHGPLAADVGQDPEVLAELCAEVGCGTVLIDSVKDLAVKLTDDTVAGNVNKAMQLACADGREVLALHHQRKGQGGAKPNTLEDVYGNMQLTAGCGSVVLLWGLAGDPLVELAHLKQPTEQVGPWTLEHNHQAGLFTVSRGFDMLAFLRGRGTVGATTTDAAKAMLYKDKPTDNERKKAQRVLERLVAEGYAAREEGAGIGQPATYFATEKPLLRLVEMSETRTDTPTDRGVSDSLHGQATDSHGQNDKRAGQATDSLHGQGVRPSATDRTALSKESSPCPQGRSEEVELEGWEDYI